ncbi:hypothetical protein WR25_24418 [Diploscapter pachys]|uniref:Neurotransmitter-gated ion-channel ligand-binding domain-containing protein n=1 Tax=Diploscapter pachys TaxID=2018661 RepID=A0A2A2LII2_9BILA|nr:hypothetical protein WR25_24418 [Diploscapter pachys]
MFVRSNAGFIKISRCGSIWEVLLYFWIFMLIQKLAQGSHHERRLYEDLMRDYNSLERPVENHSMPVVVYLKVSLQQIIDVDEKNQIVYVNAWLDYTWDDYKLVWDTGEYGNITDVRFPAGRIWKPDVLLYNSVDQNFDSTYPTNLVVYSTGQVHWIPPGIFKISCKIDIQWFPFDEQKCFFKFGSWTYDGYKLDLRPATGGFDISEYLPNGEWALPWFNLIMPCILTTLMTLLGFTLPPDAGEKITLRKTSTNKTNVVNASYRDNRVFFTCCLIVVTASTVFTVYVLNLHYRTPETHEMGSFTRALLLFWLPWVLRMKRPGVKFTYATLPPLFCRKPKRHSESLIRNIKENEASHSRSNSLEVERRMHQYLTMGGLGNGLGPPVPGQISHLNSPHGSDAVQQATLLVLQRIYHELKIVTKRMVETDKEEQATNNLKLSAMVVDRMCLYLFTIFIIASSVAIFWSAPYLSA